MSEIDTLLKVIAEDGWLCHVRTYVPSAWIGHAPFLRFLIREIRPRIFVELGTHNGFSYFLACQTIQELGLETKAFAVDHWLGDQHAGIFDESVYQSVVSHNEQYDSFSTLVKMSFTEARAEILDTIDLLHIDGLHTYEAVKDDFDTWLPKMAKDGIILLHDIHVRHADFGVFKLWSEIKKDFSTIEFTGTYGLGVVFLGSIPSETLTLIKQYCDSGEMMQVQGVFGALSDGVLQNYRYTEESRSSTAIEELNITNHATMDELTLIKNSKSWRLTKPLRLLNSFLPKINRRDE